MENFLYNNLINYQIIYLNGASSSGKTTLARELQSKLKDYFLVIGIDQIIYMMPDKANDWHNDKIAPGFSWIPVKNELGHILSYRINSGPFGQLMLQMFKNIVKTLACSGYYLIIDDVSFGKEQFGQWKEQLKDFNVLWTGVTAPLEVLKQREIERGDRKIGSTIWQSEHVYLGVGYDLIIDTCEKSLSENIDLIYKLVYK